MQQEILKKYIRNSKNQPVGVAIARREGETVHYGFSLCNTRLDQWSKEKGTKIAIARSHAPTYQLPKVRERESAVLDAYEDLEHRALKYFKDIPPENVVISTKINLGLFDL